MRESVPATRRSPAWRVGLSLVLIFVCIRLAEAGPLQTRNVIFVTTDGLRWQEVFQGADQSLIRDVQGSVVDARTMRREFWRDTPEARREALMPFLWSEIAKRGQVFGNQPKGSIARVANASRVSYPGYSEMLTGWADPTITDNVNAPNPNVTVLEWLNGRPAFAGRVAVFANWELFPLIVNRDRSKLPVWTGRERTTEETGSPRLALLEQVSTDLPPVWRNTTFDAFIHHAAIGHLREHKPRVLWVAYMETDEWGHRNQYGLYLHAARRVDGFLKRLWETAQAMPEYRGTTTLLVTTDHGRGSKPSDWTTHNRDTEGSEGTWIAAMGPDTPPLGERSNVGPVTQSQIAATLAALLGEDYGAANPKAAPPIAQVVGKR